MKHNKRYVIVLTAWVLVLVTVMATPASAASLTGFQIRLSDLEVNTVTTGLKSVVEYSYPGSYGSTSTFTYKRPNSTSYLSGFTDQYTANSTGSFSYSISPGRYKAGSKYATQTDLFYFDDLLLFNDISSCMLTSSFVLSSDADTSGTFTCRIEFVDSEELSSSGSWTYSIKGTVSKTLNYELSAGEYKEFNFEVDILEKMLNSGADCFFIEYTLYFKNFPSGATFNWGWSSPSNSYDDLNKGFRVFLTTEKTISAPVWNKNLSSYAAYTTDDDSFVLSVSASVSDGGTVTYQWYRGATAAGATPIHDATNPVLTVMTSQPSDYYYYCVATNNNLGGTKSSISNVAHVVVVDPPEKPQIVYNLADGAVVEYIQGSASSPLNFSAVVTDGGKLSYQWYMREPDGQLQEIQGATETNYIPSTQEIGTKYYYCVATNTKAGFTASVESGLVAVRIVSPPDPALPPVITSDLSTDPVEYEEDKTPDPLRIGATSPDGGVLSYQWYELKDGFSSLLPGEIYATFSPSTVDPGTRFYFCIVTNSLNNTSATAHSSIAQVVVKADQTDSLLDTIIGGVNDVIEGITSLPEKLIEGIKGLFVPDTDTMVGYQDRWFSLLASRFGAIYQAVVLIDEFGQAISDQAASGVVDFPQVTINLSGTPFTFGGWKVDVVPDGFALIFDALKLMIDIVATLAFINGLRHRFEGILGGE